MQMAPQDFAGLGYLLTVHQSVFCVSFVPQAENSTYFMDTYSFRTPVKFDLVRSLLKETHTENLGVPYISWEGLRQRSCKALAGLPHNEGWGIRNSLVCYISKRNEWSRKGCSWML